MTSTNLQRSVRLPTLVILALVALAPVTGCAGGADARIARWMRAWPLLDEFCGEPRDPLAELPASL
jgi:hypothetical protein